MAEIHVLADEPWQEEVPYLMPHFIPQHPTAYAAENHAWDHERSVTHGYTPEAAGRAPVRVHARSSAFRDGMERNMGRTCSWRAWRHWSQMSATTSDATRRKRDLSMTSQHIVFDQGAATRSSVSTCLLYTSPSPRD